MNALITSNDLKKATGYERDGDVEKCLRKNGVRVLYGKAGKIFTTLDAMNAALGIKSDRDDGDHVELVD